MLKDLSNSVALLVQIHLSQYRLDLAKKEVQRARSWAQDNLLVNLAESWVGLREVSFSCVLSILALANRHPATTC